MNLRILVIMAFLFVAPIIAVLALNAESILEDMKPRPENGYLIYVTANT
jgi:hypothetical protein